MSWFVKPIGKMCFSLKVCVEPSAGQTTKTGSFDCPLAKSGEVEFTDVIKIRQHGLAGWQPLG